MYISDRRMIMLLQDIFNSKKEDWNAAITSVIKDFVMTLPTQVKTVLEARYGLTCDLGSLQVPQIAQSLGISQNEVSAHLNQGYRSIRRFLTDNRFNIIELTADQAVTQVIKERERMLDYQQGEKHTLTELPAEFYEVWQLKKFGLSAETASYLESLHVYLVGEIVVARPQEIELSPHCSDRVRLEIRAMLEKFNLKRGMNLTYEDFTNLFNKRREQEIMQLSASATMRAMQNDLEEIFEWSFDPAPEKKSKKK